MDFELGLVYFSIYGMQFAKASRFSESLSNCYGQHAHIHKSLSEGFQL